MDIEKKDNIELRSKDIQEVIGKIPPIIIRIGISIIILVVLLILVFVSSLEYPEYVKAPAIAKKTELETHAFVFEIYVHAENIINIKINQPVFLNIDQYPESEYGLFQGNIDSVKNILFTKEDKKYYIAYSSIDFSIIKDTISLKELTGIAEIEINRKKIINIIVNK